MALIPEQFPTADCPEIYKKYGTADSFEILIKFPIIDGSYCILIPNCQSPEIQIKYPTADSLESQIKFPIELPIAWKFKKMSIAAYPKSM